MQVACYTAVAAEVGGEAAVWDGAGGYIPGPNCNFEVELNCASNAAVNAVLVAPVVVCCMLAVPEFECV